MSNSTTTKVELPAMLRTCAKARLVGTPIIAISTTDNLATLQGVNRAFESQDASGPAFEWDVATGLQAVNEAGRRVIGDIGPEAGKGNINELFLSGGVADRIPEDGVLFLHNPHWAFQNPIALQGMINARDPYKATGRTLILLANQFTFPLEFSNHVLPLDEALPTAAELEAMVRSHYENTRAETTVMPELSEENLDRAVNALLGLSFFPAENALMISLTRSGIDFEQLWERKRKLVEQTKGLKIYRGKERFSDIAGLQVIKEDLQAVIHGKRRPNVVVLFDELEKMLGGSGQDGLGDSSGTSQDQLQQLLTWMEDNDVRGILEVGFPGGGKTLMAKAMGAEAACPTIIGDLGGMKHGIVGSSEENIRAALKVIDAIGQGKVFVIASINRLKNVPPELRRRFTQIYMFDLPTKEERVAAWMIHSKAKGVELTLSQAEAIDFDEGWTNADVKKCVQLMDELGYSLDRASRSIVPVSRSMAQEIDELRALASGRFLDASRPGVYDSARAVADLNSRPAATGGRKARMLTS